MQIANETEAPLSGVVIALLHEVKASLAQLVDSGKETIINLRAMPFGPNDLALLDNFLGEGEVSATLKLSGQSQITETKFSGVWRIRHFGQGHNIMVDEIAITQIPPIMCSQIEDVAMAASNLDIQLGSQSVPN